MEEKESRGKETEDVCKVHDSQQQDSPSSKSIDSVNQLTTHEFIEDLHPWFLLSLTWSDWDLPMMTEGICPSIPGILRWPSSHVPGMDI